MRLTKRLYGIEANWITQHYILRVCDNAQNHISILTTELSWLSKISRYLYNHIYKVIVLHISAIRRQ